jgi:pyruvate kinase
VSRRLALVWGVHSVHGEDSQDTNQLAETAADLARESGLAQSGQHVVILAGMPFGQSGTTNMMRIATV